MNKFAILVLIVICAVSAYAGPMQYQGLKDYVTGFNVSHRLGVERVTHFDSRVNIERLYTFVDLNATMNYYFPGTGRGGISPRFMRGRAMVTSEIANGLPKAEVRIRTKDLPDSGKDHTQFEAWLVDDDSGYRLSVGTFVTGFGGVAELVYHVNNYLDAYDRVELTIEPWNDLDVLPGQVILAGIIDHEKAFNPPAKSAKMATGGFEIV